MKKLLFVVCAALLLAGCGDDESAPLVEPGGAFIPEPDPYRFFVAIVAGLADESSDLYVMYFSEDFVFSPTPYDSLRGEFAGSGVFGHWTRPVESSALRPLFNDAGSIDVVFTPTTEINTTRFVRYRVEYQLSVTRTGGDITEYRGVAHFDLAMEKGTWRLVRWDEIANVDGYESWGYLRGTLRPRVYRVGSR